MKPKPRKLSSAMVVKRKKISVSASRLNSIKKTENIKAKLMAKKESQRNFWLKNYKKIYSNIMFYQLVAVK